MEGILSKQFSNTSLLLCIIWIIIESSSSSSHLHLDLNHHHSIWIISGSETSLLDHHHRCYLLILLIIGSSTELSLFHVGCSPSLQVGLCLPQHLYLTMIGNSFTHHVRKALYLHMTMIGNFIHTSCQKGSALTSDHDRKLYSHIMSERLCTYI